MFEKTFKPGDKVWVELNIRKVALGKDGIEYMVESDTGILYAKPEQVKPYEAIQAPAASH